MKRTIFAIAAAIAVFSVPTWAADVGVSISIGQPGFYGQIDIGNFPRPPLIYPEPVIIRPVPVGVVVQPVYLRVPPGHAKDWGRYCGRYNACGRPVYFVQDRWYNEVYVPRYQEQHRGGHDEGRGRGNGKEKHKGNKHD